MFSFSIHRACYALVALGLLMGLPVQAQHTQHPAGDTTMKMPMNMKMGSPTKKKSTAKSRTSTAKKKTPAAKPKSGTRPAAKKHRTKMNMNMPARSAKSGKAAPMAGMKMDSHPATAHADSTPANMPRMAGMAGVKHDSAAAMKGMAPGMKMPAAHGHTTEDMMIGPAGVSMERMGSGTTWIPDAVTMPNRRRMLGDWMIMAHGFAFAQYDKQSGERGDDQFGSLNWAMLMATHDLAGGRFQVRTMLSLDAFTVTSRGYPLLLQSGESFDGEPLHDRQHPHDFWMELGALYQRQINRNLAWSIYAAPSGEPALGPVAFMHRPSAMDNPTAPISHHWQDATHVSFGVLTTGIYTHAWQIEGSVFNGREPDQRRWNFDSIHLDSYSGRLTMNPSRSWSFSGGYGYLKSPEAFNPAESMHRITTSIQHGSTWGSTGQVASTLIWGVNKHSTATALANSFLLESEAILDRSNTLFGRTEFVQKSAEDLVVSDPSVTSGGVVLPGFPTDKHFNVGTMQLGYIRELARSHWATVGLGAAGTLNFVPGALEPYYGSRTPAGGIVFLRLRPFHSSRKEITNMGGMKMDASPE
ncbi:MAG TPA: hypothetical protein VM166_00590 [Gemmatimonadaceae bacterium]|nr:hypothetical protein [Gemmatimonadaceae bacterium]